MGVFIALCTGRKPQMQETINNQQKILQIIHQGISTGIEILFSKAIVTIKPNGTAMQYIMPISITTIDVYTRQAHKKDGIALTKLIYWLKHVEDKRQITELAVCDKLEEFRRQGEGYLGQSFAPIAAYGLSLIHI